MESKYLPVVTACYSPSTIREVADKTQLKYHTARKYMVELMNMGVITELGHFRDRQKLYQATLVFDTKDEQGNTKELQFKVFDQEVTANNLITLLLTTDKPSLYISHLSRILITLIKRHELLSQGVDKTNLPGANEKQLRKLVEDIRAWFENITQLCDQLLISPAWQGNKAHQLMSIPPEVNSEQLALELEHWMLDQGRL